MFITFTPTGIWTLTVIKEVTAHDMAAGVCGTPAEAMVYFVCDKCR